MQGELSIKGVGNGFGSNNALYSESLSFTTFIFLSTLFDTNDYQYFE